ncbi:MAG TPA: xanthine dehydrogenase family protein subunit M [Tepidisphaeraceae bacterium]|nr:xanthine dehydrogenase family protein subunit M [Tepidisphaeraceae bacterium]
MNNFEWAEATNIDEAMSLITDTSAYKAGGVDLLDLMKEHIAAPKRIVNIRNISGFDQIKEDGGVLHLGPMLTLAKIADDKTIRSKCAAIADSAGHAATPQIRNMATLGGNLLQRPRCWYFRNELFHCRKKGGEICYAQEGENQYHAIFNNQLCAIVHPSALACALVAHGAKLEIAGAGDKKREAVLEEFLTLPSVDLHRENSIQPGELITDILVPTPADGTKSIYIKQGEKESFDWPIAEIAMVLTMDGEKCKSASIVLGAAAPVPHRAKEAEAALIGQAINEQTAQAVAKAAVNGATPLAQNGYKISLFENLLTRTLLAAKGNA